MAIVTLSMLLTGCVPVLSGPEKAELQPGELIARSDNFMLVRSRPGDDFSSLARRLYGSAAEASRLSTLNPPPDPVGGSVLAAPVRVLNPSGVYAAGYRTIPILSYHQFTARKQARSRLQLPVAAFRAQLRFLRDHGYQVLRLSELPEYLNGEREIPSRSVVITIDDGYRSVYEIAWPVLREFGYPATLFVYTDFIGVGASVSWAQMKAMMASGLIDIQSHARSHASVAAAPPGVEDFHSWLTREVAGSRRILEKGLGHRVDQFSYPYGESSEAAVALLKKHGYRLAATVQRGGNPVFADAFRLRRTMVYSDDTIAAFKRKVQVLVPLRGR